MSKFISAIFAIALLTGTVLAATTISPSILQLCAALLIAGLLAGLIQYYVDFKGLPQYQPPAKQGSNESFGETPEPDFLTRILTFLRAHWQFSGYLVVGIAGSFLVPVINAIVPLKGVSEFLLCLGKKGTCDQNGWNILIIFGYGIISGYSSVRIIRGIGSFFLGNITKDVSEQEKALKAAQGRIADLEQKVIAHRGTLESVLHRTMQGEAGGEYLESGALEAPSALPAHFAEVINLPGNTADYRRGIDISHHNRITDWASIKKAGVTFVYIKISEGVGTPDKEAQTHAIAARDQGLDIGYYHFARPDKRSGGTLKSDADAEAAEVNNIVNSIGVEATMPLMLDLENAGTWDTPLSKEEYLAWAEYFLGHFYNPIFPNKVPFIYSRAEYLNRRLPATHTLGKRFPLWLSRYNKDARLAVPPVGWDRWTIWQFTEMGILGSNGVLDLNFYRV